MHLIGLHGRLHSGKDTTFDFLKEEGERLGLVVQRIAFADYLKVSGAVALGGLGEDPKDLSPEGRQRLVEAANDFKEEGSISVISHRRDGSTFGTIIDGRTFWQVYGTESHRQALDSPDFWIDMLLKRATSIDDLARVYPEVDVLVITDVRFDNEAKAIKRLDRARSSNEPDPRGRVTIVKVDRGDTSEVTHASEAGISDDLVDYVIDNSGDLDTLRQEARALLFSL